MKKKILRTNKVNKMGEELRETKVRILVDESDLDDALEVLDELGIDYDII